MKINIAAGPPAPPPPPPAPVQVTKFEQKPDTLLVEQIVTNPVPPGPEPFIPSDYAGYVEKAKVVSRGAMTDKAQLWAMLAQAEATNRLADLLEEFLTFVNPDELEGEELPSGLSAAIADGLLMAAQEQAKEAAEERASKKHGK